MSSENKQADSGTFSGKQGTEEVVWVHRNELVGRHQEFWVTYKAGDPVGFTRIDGSTSTVLKLTYEDGSGLTRVHTAESFRNWVAWKLIEAGKQLNKDDLKVYEYAPAGKGDSAANTPGLFKKGLYAVKQTVNPEPGRERAWVLRDDTDPPRECWLLRADGFPFAWPSEGMPALEFEFTLVNQTPQFKDLYDRALEQVDSSEKKKHMFTVQDKLVLLR